MAASPIYERAEPVQLGFTSSHPDFTKSGNYMFSTAPNQTAEVTEQSVQIRERGITITLIEHKLSLVMAISDRVVVMDYGKEIADAPPAEVAVDPAVVEAYLGRRVRSEETGDGGRETAAAIDPESASGASA